MVGTVRHRAMQPSPGEEIEIHVVQGLSVGRSAVLYPQVRVLLCDDVDLSFCEKRMARTAFNNTRQTYSLPIL